jgi:hypothetical protein
MLMKQLAAEESNQQRKKFQCEHAYAHPCFEFPKFRGVEQPVYICLVCWLDRNLGVLIDHKTLQQGDERVKPRKAGAIVNSSAPLQHTPEWTASI